MHVCMYTWYTCYYYYYYYFTDKREIIASFASLFKGTTVTCCVGTSYTRVPACQLGESLLTTLSVRAFDRTDIALVRAPFNNIFMLHVNVQWSGRGRNGVEKISNTAHLITCTYNRTGFAAVALYAHTNSGYQFGLCVLLVKCISFVTYTYNVYPYICKYNLVRVRVCMCVRNTRIYARDTGYAGRVRPHETVLMNGQVTTRDDGNRWRRARKNSSYSFV